MTVEGVGLLEHLQTPAMVVARGQVRFANSAAKALLGVHIVGQDVRIAIRDPKAVAAILSEKGGTAQVSGLSTGGSVWQVDCRVLASNERLVSLYDLSERVSVAKSHADFVANASHELRTPLASLRGFIETMQGPARDDAKAKDRFLTIMLDQANRMSRLVDDLLSLSRLELKAHVAPDQKVELAPILGHVRDSLAPLAAELGVEIRLDLPEEKVEVMGERDELVQVFENLMENACKYGQDGKYVDVSLRREPGGATEVSVRDHGPGIPAEHVPRLTERFYRVNVEDSRSKKGTGLGLAIVKHILTRHRARLIVRSDLGAGSVFTVRF